MIYVLWDILPFATNLDRSTITFPTTSVNNDEGQETLELLLEALAPAFFADQPSEKGLRASLVTALDIFLPTPLQAWYRALAPDFFAWVEA